jgi:hypothetical protein
MASFETTLSSMLGTGSLVVVAWPHHPTGRIRTRISRDGGATFSSQQEWATTRTYHRIGLACPKVDVCILAFSDGNQPQTRWRFAYLNYDLMSGLFVLGQSGDLGFDSYGGGVSFSSNRIQFGWRDRGTATVPATAGWTYGSTVPNTLTYLTDVAHSAPVVAHNASQGRFTIWWTHYSGYNQ